MQTYVPNILKIKNQREYKITKGSAHIMEIRYTMKLKDVVEEHALTVVHAADDYETCTISTYNVARPGLQLAGFYDYFQPDQIQIMGKMEMAYLRNLTEEERKRSIDVYMSHGLCAVVICHRVPVDSDIVDAARRYNINLFTTDLGTSAFMAQLINTLRTNLAPRITVHGVLIEVHGEGVLITGDSGIGKSETALELVKRGHRLVADDAVEILRMSRTQVVGAAPEMIRYLMELRGVGVIDVRRIYGVGAVLENSKIDLVVNFEKWDNDKNYDRLGLEEETTSFLGVKVPHITVPVAPARNLAIILEVAAINNRQKRMGFNAAADLAMRHDVSVDNGWKS